MKLATTTDDFNGYGLTSTEKIKAFEGTGFKYLDYNFYKELYPGSPFLGSDWMRDIEEAKEAADSLGFTFVQAHSPDYDPCNPSVDHEAGMLATIRSIEACRYLGIENIVVHPGIGYKYPEERQAWFDFNKKFYSALFPVMEKTGVNVLIENGAENNVGDRCDFMKAQDMVDFVEYVNHPLLHICWDVGHANLRNTNQHDDIMLMGKELYALHIQDNQGDFDEHTAPFMGTINMDAIMQGLIESGYKGYFTFESGNMMPGEHSWPHARYQFQGNMPSRLMKASLDLRRKAEGLLYEIGKFILTSYDVFEE